MNLWENHIYKKLNIQSGNYKPLKIDENFKEIINELLSFVSKFKSYNFIHGDLKLSNILYDNQTNNFTLKDFEKSKFKLNELTNDEYYFDFISLYFDLCKLNNKSLTNYLQNEVIKYIPYLEIYKFHNVTNCVNGINCVNEIIDLYKF